MPGAGDTLARRAVRALAALGLASCLSVTACAGGSRSGMGGPGGPAASASPSPQSTAVPHGIRKVLLVMEENHSRQDVFPAGMPYLWGLARRYSYATDWRDIGHPSLPNYLAIVAGSRFNQPQDCDPGPGCTYPGPTVFGEALARGGTARAYEESMPRPCDTVSSGYYDVNHNPWAYFPDEAARCRAHDVGAGTPASGPLSFDTRHGSLPSVGLVTPNLMDDAHDGTLADADAWLRRWVPTLMSGPDWRSGRLAIVVVFDEGDVSEQVPLVLMDPQVHGAVLRTPADHYSLTRLIDQVIGVPLLRHAATAPGIAPLFALP